jgi:CRP-like cAMP-binding protein
MKPLDVLIKKLKHHSKLDSADLEAIRTLGCEFRMLRADEDFICQGEKPFKSAVVVEGVVARYHTLAGGGRQYLSLHIVGDWPDAQGLFLERMDHSVCAVGGAVLCTIPHRELIEAFRARPNVGFAVWRETLIDAAIFREAITNNSSRPGTARLAHFFAEIFYRSEANNLVKDNSCALPLNQTQIGEMLGMSIATVSRHLQRLRQSKVADLRGGQLVVSNPNKLHAIGDFDPLYLHAAVQPNV